MQSTIQIECPREILLVCTWTQTDSPTWSRRKPRWPCFARVACRLAWFINGDGETSRDFCYIANTVQANLLAATAEHPEAVNQIYNVAVGDRTTLNDLFGAIRTTLKPHCLHLDALSQPIASFE